MVDLLRREAGSGWSTGENLTSRLPPLLAKDLPPYAPSRKLTVPQTELSLEVERSKLSKVFILVGAGRGVEPP
jgi:hypothetical protein